MKIKQVGNALHIITKDASAVMPMTNKQETEKAINTLIEVIYQASHTNAELQKSVMDDNLVEGFETQSNLALLNDLMVNIPNHVVKSSKDSISYAPTALQPQVMKHFANAISRVYKDAAEMVLSANDTTLLARSLLQKSILIGRDVELLSDKLDEPLEKLKSIKQERILRKSVLKAGVKQGETLAMAHYGTFDKDVLDTARSIQKARNTAETKDKSKQKAIKDALRASK